MEKRKRGNSELYINPVGLGCMGFSHASGDPTEKSVAVRTLREAYECRRHENDSIRSRF